MSNEFLTLKEVSAMLQVSEQTIRNYIKKGDLIAIKFGNTHRAPVRIRRSDLDTFLGANIYEGSNDDDANTGDDNHD